MSLKPTFVTGATAKIRLNGKTLAFVQDFQCSIQIITQTPKVLGKYEGDSVEPLGILVNGSFSILRYAKGIKAVNGKTPFGLAENDAGNGVGNWGNSWDMGGNSVIGNNGRAHEALDPSKFAKGTTFDIQVYQKVSIPVPQDTTNGLRDISDISRGAQLSESGESDFLGILNIRNARITQADFAIQKRSVATERFNFTALYVDGDSFVANNSGVT